MTAVLISRKLKVGTYKSSIWAYHYQCKVLSKVVMYLLNFVFLLNFEVNTDMFKTYLLIFCYWKLRWMRRRKHGVGESFSWEEGRSQPCGQKLVPAGSLLRWPTVKHFPVLMLDTLLDCRTPFWTVEHPVRLSDTLLDCWTTCSPVKHPVWLS